MKTSLCIAVLLALQLIASGAAVADTVADRAANLQKLIAKGIISRTEIADGVPRLYVAAKFMDSARHSQEAFAARVFEYFNWSDPAKTRLLVFDASTGKQIGEYSPSTGLVSR